MPKVPALPFFIDATEEILTLFMASQGFTVVDRDDAFVEYRQNGKRVSFSYWPEDLPRATLSIAVGLEDPDGRVSSIALWRGLKESDPACAYTRWEFASEPELREVLARVIREVMPRVIPVERRGEGSRSHRGAGCRAREGLPGEGAEERVDGDKKSVR